MTLSRASGTLGRSNERGRDDQDQDTDRHVCRSGSAGGIGVASAEAAPPEPFTITETIDGIGREFTFTATGTLCPAGTFEDVVESIGGNPDKTGKLNILVRTVYTCDDGSGTFNAQKHFFITVNEDGSITNTGPVTLHGGTGDYTGLSGHGTLVGATDADLQGVGNISGVLRLG